MLKILRQSMHGSCQGRPTSFSTASMSCRGINGARGHPMAWSLCRSRRWQPRPRTGDVVQALVRPPTCGAGARTDRSLCGRWACHRGGRLGRAPQDMSTVYRCWMQLVRCGRHGGACLQAQRGRGNSTTRGVQSVLAEVVEEEVAMPIPSPKNNRNSLKLAQAGVLVLTPWQLEYQSWVLGKDEDLEVLKQD